MNQILPLTHCQQSAPGYCLPACCRMVLANQGLDFSEEKLSKRLGTNVAGTPAFAIAKLETFRVHVDYGVWSIGRLSKSLADGNPVISFVRTIFMDHWDSDAAHAVVLVGIEMKSKFWVYDPALATGPIAVSWDGMLAAWFEFNYQGATLTRKKPFGIF